jgi:hypothetical protein
MQADFFVGGTDPNLGGLIDMTVYGSDFVVPGVEHFFICPETTDPLAVQLADGSDFTITTVQMTSYLGFWMPLAIKTVYQAGSIGIFSFGY